MTRKDTSIHGRRSDWRAVGDAVFGPQRSKRRLVWAKHTRKWEAAHQEFGTDHWQWIRDDMSFICQVGDEVAVADLPPAPRKTAMILRRKG